MTYAVVSRSGEVGLLAKREPLYYVYFNFTNLSYVKNMLNIYVL